MAVRFILGSQKMCNDAGREHNVYIERWYKRYNNTDKPAWYAQYRRNGHALCEHRLLVYSSHSCISLQAVAAWGKDIRYIGDLILTTVQRH